MIEIDTSTSRICYDPASRIIISETRNGTVFDVEHAIESKNAALHLVGDGMKYTVLFTSEGNIVTTPAVRKFCASAEFNNSHHAVALLSTSSAMKVLANFYMRLNRPVVPTRFFDNKENAIKWLTTFALQQVSI